MHHTVLDPANPEQNTMGQSEIQTVVLIGAGNVGWHLGLALNEKGIRILQVISKSQASCKELADLLHADYTTSLQQLETEAGIIILAVPDSQIDAIIGHCDFRDNLVVHTAGSVPIDAFKGNAVNYGVLYPLMTFTRHKPVDFASVPLLIEASSIRNYNKLNSLAKCLSKEVTAMTTEQRKIIHLAAVFACNFTNHMYTLAEDVLAHEGIPFKLLKPLIRETADKINRLSPHDAQTGPAVRNDTSTLEEHLRLLASHPEIAELYCQISKSIITFARQEKKGNRSQFPGIP
jgi:predicted short-subunit dehydrogenase-like oxidoreductase (DUF2520 family)